jgi:hypothetical protein
MIGWYRRWYRRWRVRRSCFHHEPRTGESFIDSMLIEMGSRKLYWCRHCGKHWVI